MNRSAFTLIELLVVITIIVVLLALLTPALDKAVYQAQLAVCGTRLHGIGLAAHAYALEHKRYYPHRISTYMPASQFQAGADIPAPDLRPLLRDYCEINKLFNDPLNEDVDFEADEGVNLQVFGDYDMWFGFRYQGNPGMLKLGDRVEYGGTRFEFLASDQNQIGNDNTDLARSNHPDHEEKMSSVKQQNEFVVFSANTLSFWQVYNTQERGPIDNNYLTEGGAVERMDGLLWNDSRTVSLPLFADGRFPLMRVFLPTR